MSMYCFKSFKYLDKFDENVLLRYFNGNRMTTTLIFHLKVVLEIT